MAEFRTQKPQDIQVGSFGTPPGPNTAEADFISTVGGLAIQGIGAAVKGYQKADLEGDIEQTSNVVATIDAAQKAGATFDPAGGVSSDISTLPKELQEGLKTVAQESQEEFAAITSAVAQGKTSQSAAALRIEALLKAKINQTPMFAIELRQLARDVAGYDPSNYHIQQILEERTPTKPSAPTKQEKQRAEADFAAQILGGKPGDYLAMIVGSEIEKQKADLANNQLKNNEIEIDEALQEIRGESHAQIGTIFGKIAAIRESGGGLSTPSEQIAAIDELKAEKKQELLLYFQKSGKRLTPDFRNSMLSQVDTDFDPLKEAVKNNGLGNILNEKSAAITALYKLQGFQTLPTITRLNIQAGERVTSQMIDVMSNIANPSQFKLLKSHFPGISALIDSRSMSDKGAANQVNNAMLAIIKGEELTGDMIDFRPMAEAVLSQPSTPPELRERAFENMGKSAPVRTSFLLARKGQRKLATEKEVEFMKQQFKANYPRVIDGVVGRIASLSKDERNSVKVSIEDGQISITSKVAGIERPIHFAEKLEKQLNMWNKAVENGWGADLDKLPGVFSIETSALLRSKIEEVNRKREEAAKNADKETGSLSEGGLGLGLTDE